MSFSTPIEAASSAADSARLMKFESADTRSTFCASTFVKPTAASRMTTTDAMAVITYNVLFDDFVFMMRSFPLR